MDEGASKDKSPALIYGLPGIALFVIGGMMLEDSFGDDWLTFLGLLAVAAGLLGIITAGVAVGGRFHDHRN